jgi:hypothetical protein
MQEKSPLLLKKQRAFNIPKQFKDITWKVIWKRLAL